MASVASVQSFPDDLIYEYVPLDTDDDQLFGFAREVRSHANYSFKELRGIFDRWYEQARGALQPAESVDPEYCFAQFLKAWANVKFLKAESPLAAAWERTECPPPPSLADALECLGPGSPIRRLGHLCLELQKGFGEQPFFISCRTVARLFSVVPATASMWLRNLETLGVLQTAMKGKRGFGGKASRFRYRLPIEPHVPCRQTSTVDHAENFTTEHNNEGTY